MTAPAPGGRPEEERDAPDAGAQRRPGVHPEVRRSGSRTSTVVVLAALGVGAALMYGAIVLGIIAAPG